MNPCSHSSVGDPAEASSFSNLSNAVYITPILTEDAAEKTFMFEDSTYRTDLLAEKYARSTIPPYPISSNLDWSSGISSSTAAYNLVDSDFICDLAKDGELSCMLSPQVLEHAFDQHYSQPMPISQSLICTVDVPVVFPVSKSLVPADLVVPNLFGEKLSDVQLLEGGLKETQKLISYGDHTSSDQEEALVVATGREKSNKMNHGRVVYPQQFEQPDMFMNDVYAALNFDITSWKNEPAGSIKIMNDCKQPKENEGGTRQRRTSVNKRKLIDLRTLLIQCAEAVGGNDFRNAKDFLTQIWRHSSPFGNASERKAHYFATALEARLNGTGSEEYAALVSKRIPTANIEACKLLISACPFIKLSNHFTIEMIMKLAKKATRIHIIHFGVPYGLQWSTLIQRLSTRPGKPPILRVTGIDLPQLGLESSVANSSHDETGHLLANFCKQFKISFEYNAITKKWENIQLEDLKIGTNEVIVVNCLYRLRHLVDEKEDLSSPRDTVLNLVRKINPDIFIHGIVNGTYNAPFFVSRFREVLYYFSSMFDMLEEIVPSEDKERMVLEENIYAKEILNVVACEGPERVVRPETYKQWQVRNLRAGLKQLPLNQEMLMTAKGHVKLHYHRDFLVDSDKNWLLQGWKGKTLYALSFWRAAKGPV